MYLDYNEFKILSLREDISKEDFEKYLSLASDILDSITNNFYVCHSLEKDVCFRSKRFKKALVCEICYLYANKATSTQDLNNMPVSISAGRTSINMGNAAANEKKSLVAEDIKYYLSGTGLLYRGV